MKLLFSHLPVNCWAVKWNRWSSKARNTSDDEVTWKLRPERWADGELALDSLVHDHSASHLIYATVSETRPKPLILQHHQTAQTWLQPVWTTTSVKGSSSPTEAQEIRSTHNAFWQSWVLWWHCFLLDFYTHGLLSVLLIWSQLFHRKCNFLASTGCRSDPFL